MPVPSPSDLKILFMGTPAFALPSLAALKQSGDKIVGVVTQPDKPKGRGMRPAMPPVKEWALKEGVPVYQPKSAKAASFIDQMRGLVPDIIVVVAYGKLLPKELLKLPRLGCVNLHASLLPKYRGAAPIQWALINGEEKTGVTTMLLDEGMDTGPLLLQREMTILEKDDFESLERRLSLLGAELLVETVAKLKRGEITPIPQPHEGASYAPMLKKEDGLIDWGRSAVEIERRVRALNPWPGTFTFISGKLLKLLKVKVICEEAGGEPGEVVAVSPEGLFVACGRGRLLITQLQPEGGRRMTAREFSLGHKVALGTILGGR
mgnify:CR=1 FL=1